METHKCVYPWFPEGFQFLPCEKRTKGLSWTFCLSIGTWSQAYPTETLAHFRVTCVVQSVNELGRQLWRVQIVVYMMKHKNMNSRCTHFLLAEHVIISGSSTIRAQIAIKILWVVLRSMSRAEGKPVVHQLLPRLCISDYYFYYITSVRET